MPSLLWGSSSMDMTAMCGWYLFFRVCVSLCGNIGRIVAIQWRWFSSCTTAFFAPNMGAIKFYPKRTGVLLKTTCRQLLLGILHPMLACYIEMGLHFPAPGRNLGLPRSPGQSVNTDGMLYFHCASFYPRALDNFHFENYTGLVHFFDLFNIL